MANPRIGIVIREDDKIKLQAVANKQKRTMSQLAALIISEWLEKHEDAKDTSNTD
jgi:hypothetical protein